MIDRPIWFWFLLMAAAAIVAHFAVTFVGWSLVALAFALSGRTGFSTL